MVTCLKVFCIHFDWFLNVDKTSMLYGAKKCMVRSKQLLANQIIMARLLPD